MNVVEVQGLLIKTIASAPLVDFWIKRRYVGYGHTYKEQVFAFLYNVPAFYELVAYEFL